MDDLLSAFDPLHVGNGDKRDPLFPGVATAVSSVDSASLSSSAATVTHPRAIPVSIEQSPLDLLSFGDAAAGHTTSNSINSQSATTSTAKHIQHTAEQRQRDVLAELENAELPVDWMGQGTSTSSTTQNTAQRRPVPSRAADSFGSFSHAPSRPPRRLSRSGLMYDTPSTSNTQYLSTQQANEQGITHALASPTSLTSSPSELFHPSSPPAGSSLDDLRHKSGYFSSLGRSFGPSASSLSSSTTANRNKGLIPQSAETSISPSHMFQNIDNSDLFASTSSSYTKQAHTTQPIASTSQSTSSSSSTRDYAPPKRSHTFDFPTTSNLSLDASNPPHSARLPNTRTTTLQSNHSFRSPKKNNGNSSNGSIGASLARAASPSTSTLNIDAEPLPPLVLKIPLAAQGGNRVLTEDIAEGIRPSLSSRLKLQKTWSLLYSLDAHGTSLTTLYSKVQAGLQKSAGGCILALRDMEGAVFGGYVNEAFTNRREGYYGNGECFLWKIDSFPSSESFRVGPLVRTYRWTGANDYLILSDSTFLSLGGGNGKFGLWIDSEFNKGFSTTCLTFKNEVLCSEKYVRPGALEGEKEAKFEIQAVECWAVG